MNNVDFISAFIPEWFTEYTFKVKSIKRLYPDIVRSHKLGGEWISEEDLLKIEKDLNEFQFLIYTDDWKESYKLYYEQAKEQKKVHANKIDIKLNALKSFSLHPIKKDRYPVFLNTMPKSEPGMYTGAIITNEIGNGIELTSSPHCLILNTEQEIDIVYYNPKISLLYKNKWGHIEFMKFPIDHLLHNDFSLMAIDTTITAFMLENMGFKIGKLISMHGTKPNELPYKKWELSQMVKYYHIMKDIDYSKRFSR